MANFDRFAWVIPVIAGALLGASTESEADTPRSPAGAPAINIEQPFSFRDRRSTNTAGYGAGDGVTFGVMTALPNGDADGDGFADSDGVSLPTRGWAAQDCVLERTLNFNPMPRNPNQFARFASFSDSGCRLLGSWRLTFTNGASTTIVETPPVPEDTSVPLVESLWMVAGGTEPAFEWLLPPGTTHNEIHVRLFDLEDLLEGDFARTILREKVAPDSTAFEVPEGILKPNHSYTFAVELRERRDQRLAARSRAYFNFTTVAQDLAAAPLVLPIVDPDGVAPGLPIAHYSFKVQSHSPVFLDAPLAAEYVVASGPDSPPFASVVLPGTHEGVFVVSYAGGPSSGVMVSPGERLTFPADGLASFTIAMTGVESIGSGSGRASLPVGVTFTEAGSFRGTVNMPSGSVALAGRQNDCGPQMVAGGAGGGAAMDLARLAESGTQVQMACLTGDREETGGGASDRGGTAN